MLKNYFKTAIRSLSRNKVYSLINTAGLAVGIAVCLVIFIFIEYEQSFDNFHPNRERIYRLLTKGEKQDSTSAVPFPLPTAIENDYPDWKVSGIFSQNNLLVNIPGRDGQTEKKFKEKSGGFLVQPSFFSIFHFSWLAGDPAKALQAKDAVVLTKAVAEKYFGDWKAAMGKTLKINGHSIVTVTGILADLPPNTDLRLKVIFPYSRANFSKNKDWWTIDSNHGCYMLLPANTSPAMVNRLLAALSKKYRTADNKSIQVIQSLGEVHFDTKAGNFSGRTIAPDRIRNLWLIAVFILVIACVNFINLSTAQAVNRAREVGVRKVLGGKRWQLTKQFLLETGILVLTGVVLAVLITALLLRPVGNILDIPRSYHFFLTNNVPLFLVAITIGVTVLAGFYPALVLSAFNPIIALKSKLVARNAKGVSLRRGLVVFQFIIAQGLIIGTLLISKQLSYFENVPMGFDKNAIVSVPFPADSLGISKIDYLRNRLLAVKGIEQVSFSGAPPADDDNWWTGFNFDHAEKGTNFAAIQKWVDPNYLATYSLQLVAGKNISGNDSVKEFLVNEKLVEKLGFSDPHAVLNKEINLWNGFAIGRIVGVVRNFYTASMRDSVAPVFMMNFKRGYNTAGIKMNAGSLSSSLASIKGIWAGTFPDYVFEYQFLDEKIASFYKDETQLSKFYQLFAGIAIFLSCLGLYGLASFMAVQRIKEVGIRKVLGATIASIVYLFSREFVLLIGIAFVIAAPLAWYFVHQWVQNYVYRIPISGWVFMLGGMGALLVALITVSFQAIRAGKTNPANSLRSE
jgi:predicted permease